MTRAVQVNGFIEDLRGPVVGVERVPGMPTEG